MAYNTKPIVTDKDGNPISQYYNKTLDQFEPVEGESGANKVILYNSDGSVNNSLSLIPILDKLSQLTGTVIDEQIRQDNELQRIALYNQILQMLNDGELKGDKGDTGKGLEFNWQGTQLGVRVEGDTEYIYVDLRGPEGPQGPAGSIDNLDKIHVVDALEYTPIKSVNNELPDSSGNVVIDVSPSIEIVNNLTETADGKALDATQGRALNNKINELFFKNTLGTVDFNTLDGRGFVGIALGGDNAPTVGDYYYIFNLIYSSGNIKQIAFGYINNKLFTRHRYQSNWSPWVEFMPTSGGTFLGEVKHGRNLVTQPQLKDYTETYFGQEQAQGNITIDLSKGNNHYLYLTGNITGINIINVPSGNVVTSFTLIVQSPNSDKSIAFPASIKWNQGVIPDTPKKLAVYTFITITSGTFWYGTQAMNGVD
jgi:hypothetical protein